MKKLYIVAIVFLSIFSFVSCINDTKIEEIVLPELLEVFVEELDSTSPKKVDFYCSVTDEDGVYWPYRTNDSEKDKAIWNAVNFYGFSLSDLPVDYDKPNELIILVFQTNVSVVSEYSDDYDYQVVVINLYDDDTVIFETGNYTTLVFKYVDEQNKGDMPNETEAALSSSVSFIWF